MSSLRCPTCCARNNPNNIRCVQCGGRMDAPVSKMIISIEELVKVKEEGFRAGLEAAAERARASGQPALARAILGWTPPAPKRKDPPRE